MSAPEPAWAVRVDQEVLAPIRRAFGPVRVLRWGDLDDEEAGPLVAPGARIEVPTATPRQVAAWLYRIPAIPVGEVLWWTDAPGLFLTVAPWGGSRRFEVGSRQRATRQPWTPTAADLEPPEGPAIEHVIQAHHREADGAPEVGGAVVLGLLGLGALARHRRATARR